MSPSLKAALALVFVVLVGAVLIQPILSASDTDPVATSPTEPAEPSEQETEEPDTPEPSPEPEPTPSPSGGVIAGPFRTQPLVDRYPARCLDRSSTGSSRLAVAGADGVVTAELGGSERDVVGERNVLGFDAGGSKVAVRAEGREVSVYDFLDGSPPKPEEGVTAWAYSPTSNCAVAVQDGGLVAEPTGPGRSVLVESGATAFAFSPDGATLAVVMREGETASVWVADLNGTRMREVHRQNALSRPSLEGWSPDGRTLYLAPGPGKSLSFVTTSRHPVSASLGGARITGLEQCSERLLGIVDGAVAEITRVGPDYLTDTDAGYTAVSCSPNGVFMAALRQGDLLLLNADGPVRDLTTDAGFRDVFADWGPAGTGLVFGRVPDGGGDAQVWYIPEGGTARDTGLRYRPGPGAIDWAASPPTGLP